MDIVSVSHPGQGSPAAPDTQSQSWLKENPGLITAVQGINDSQLFGEDGEWTLAIDQQTRLPVIRIISRQTDQVVMQLPAEYILQLQQSLRSRPDTYQKSDSAATDQEGPDQPNGY
jgi:uncharacterized FlaG/YvyC family protein